MLRKTILSFFAVFLAALFCNAESVPSASGNGGSSSVLHFSELWGYVMTGEEDALSADNPCTDIGYFISAFDEFSELPAVPPRERHFGSGGRRIHVTTSVDSRSQTHLLLDPSLPLRKRAIKSLIQASESYDGLQIDWELVPKRDREHFLGFLKEIRKKLKGKTLSVAVPARVKTLADDPYDYAAIASVADKLIVMAYDEHWSRSAPGPVASVSWGLRVAEYARSVVPPEKLVIGCPFYSRAWNDEKTGGKAYRNKNVSKIRDENSGITFAESADGDLSFSFRTETLVTVFYDTVASGLARCRAYREHGIDSLAFWRIGQEEAEFWRGITAD